MVLVVTAVLVVTVVLVVMVVLVVHVLVVTAVLVVMVVMVVHSRQVAPPPVFPFLVVQLGQSTGLQQGVLVSGQNDELPAEKQQKAVEVILQAVIGRHGGVLLKAFEGPLSQNGGLRGVEDGFNGGVGPARDQFKHVSFMHPSPH